MPSACSPVSVVSIATAAAVRGNSPEDTDCSISVSKKSLRREQILRLSIGTALTVVGARSTLGRSGEKNG